MWLYPKQRLLQQYLAPHCGALGVGVVWDIIHLHPNDQQTLNTHFKSAKCSSLPIYQTDFTRPLPLIYLSSASHPHASPPGTANDPQIASHLSSRLFFSPPLLSALLALQHIHPMRCQLWPACGSQQCNLETMHPIHSAMLSVCQRAVQFNLHWLST